MDSVGHSIKVLRTNAGEKQKDFASRVGVSAAYLSLVESNQREPTLALLRKICKELNVPLSMLFLLADESSATLDAQSKEVFSAFTSALLQYHKIAIKRASAQEQPPARKGRTPRKAAGRIAP